MDEASVHRVHAECVPPLLHVLEHHPRIASVSVREMDAAVCWTQGGRCRSIYVDHAEIALKGIVELMDNNPLVCADDFSLPSPAATLALLALGPLAEAGLILERPAMMVSVDSAESEIGPFLETVGWMDGVTVAGQALDLGGAIAATVICAIDTPDRLEDIDELYEDRYARSFFVRRDEMSDWDSGLVIGKPYGVYRLRVTPDTPTSLLRIQIIADLAGKCGAAQVVHAMNVMCGYEESLGIG